MHISKASTAPTASKEVAKVATLVLVIFLPFDTSFHASGAFDAFEMKIIERQSQRRETFLAVLHSALPFPAASSDGELPADHSAASKWFVVWPTTPDATRIVVKANPLHPDTQKAGAEAMNTINAAVAAAERKAQAAYDKALEELRRTGKGSDIESITLDDEGVAGERIDAELELVIELQAAAPFEVASSRPPEIAAGMRGPAWILTIPANTYRAKRGPDVREHFRAAEVRLYFGALAKPEIARKGDEPLFSVTFPTVADSFAVVLRGNESLLKQVVGSADWSKFR